MSESFDDELQLCPYCNREESICDCTEEDIDQMYREWEEAEERHDRNQAEIEYDRDLWMNDDGSV